MAIRLTPPIDAQGFWEIKPPFAVNPQVIYTCDAIRDFSDFYTQNIDVQKTFYNPVGLYDGQPNPVDNTVFSFAGERAARANIISLIDASGNVIYVPDTFIVAYPGMPNQPYSHIVLAVSLGAIPDLEPLDQLERAIQNLVAQTIGVVPLVQIMRAPSRNNPSTSQHNLLTTVRAAAIGGLETDLAQKLETAAQNTILQGHVAALEGLLRKHDILP